MTTLQMKGILGLAGLILIAGLVGLGCGDTSASASLDTVIGQPNGGITGSVRDMILFVSVRTGGSEVWAVSATGDRLLRLTASGAQEQTPCWSPSGREFMFSSSYITEADLYRARIDNTTLVNNEGEAVYFYQLTSRAGSNFGPDWSVTDQIVFHSDRDHPEYEIYTMDITGGNVVRLTNNEWADNSAKWSPDGTRIVFSSNRDTGTPQIYEMNADGSGVRQLTNVEAGRGALAPAYSPDGNTIAYVIQEANGDRDIWLMDRNGGNQVRLTDDGWGNHRPTWSPDGRRLTYEHFGREPVPDIWVMNADGTGKVQLTDDRDHDSSPSWSPVQAVF